jgi:methyl-accepting chemotaxis protein
MMRNWTFVRRIVAGFTVMVVLIVAVGVVAVISLNGVVSSKDRVINVNAHLLYVAETLSNSVNEKQSANRAFLLTGDPKYLDQLTAARQAFQAGLKTLQAGVDDAAQQKLIAVIRQDESAHDQYVDADIALRQQTSSLAAIDSVFDNPASSSSRAKLNSDIATFVREENQSLASARQASTDTATTAVVLIVVIAVLAVLIAIGLAFLLTRWLRRSVGTAVAGVKSSSAELQATANQQATLAKEQATAMSEISTTIGELLATSRQIAESAQSVAQFAQQTASAGRSGEDTVNKAQESIAEIRRQMDVIVDLMIEFGDKSQQIGTVVDIVTELAEQTNILAINSTIEAAGAGEAGKRFAVVADEIRKLADRVADSTKEIRGLIEVVRSAVNTTVMATETGSKSVDAGSKQFADVADAFGEIAELVSTTTDAAREIELSTKQQTTAVEQVNVAISSVAQSTKEAEVSSAQTFQTASELLDLSEGLTKLVEAEAKG